MPVVSSFGVKQERRYLLLSTKLTGSSLSLSPLLLFSFQKHETMLNLSSFPAQKAKRDKTSQSSINFNSFPQLGVPG